MWQGWNWRDGNFGGSGLQPLLKNLPPLVDTVTVKVANVTKHDDHQVEIREADTNLLIWRAWDFEPDFEYNFKQQLQRFIKK
ncbi:DUF905 domain-containing protein [Escherichia coli]|nr:DUF905 domain-containing protein [Escherichia coli]